MLKYLDATPKTPGIEKYTYDAFGKPTVTDWEGGSERYGSWYWNRFLFRGREYFPELGGLYDMRNRFYHPILGRFLQTDPIGFGGRDANLYRYCGGDPVNYADPSGLKRKIYNKDGGGSGGGKEGVTERVTVYGNPVETAGTANIGYTGPPSLVDFTPNDHGLSETGGARGPSDRNRLKNATDWLAERHPELKPRERKIQEGPLPEDVPGQYDYFDTHVITIDPDQIHDINFYVEVLAHELMHALDSFWTNLMEELFGPTERHIEHYRNSDAIGREYSEYHSFMMKTLPIVTTLLILTTMFLQYLQSVALWWHAKLYKISGIDPTLIADHGRLLQRWQWTISGLALLCLALVVITWIHRLWHPWLAIGVTFLWMWMFWSFLSIN